MWPVRALTNTLCTDPSVEPDSIGAAFAQAVQLCILPLSLNSG